jgi:thiosulfate/3-mercaptopyruvate sulfurtransferase
MLNSWTDAPNGHLLVDGAWLAGRLGDPDLRIFDCTTLLVPDEELGYRIADARDNWAAGHIPGSGYLNCQDDMCDTSHEHRFMLADPGPFAAKVGALGIGDDTRVVLYSTAQLFWATRAWWALYAMGCDNAVVLQGGFQSWSAEDRPVSTEPCAYPPATFTPNRRADVVLDKNDVLAVLGDPDVAVVNALSAEQYAGTGGMAFGRPGRIAGSANAPYPGLSDMEAGTLNGPAVVGDIFAAADATADKRIVNYCGGGISATIGFFAQKLLGYGNVAMYDASMQEWGFDDTLPMERD